MQDVLHGPAGELTQMRYVWWVGSNPGGDQKYLETRQYNAGGQMTRLTVLGDWGLSFSYDGFGNRTAQSVTKGSAPSSSLIVDGNTNRVISGWAYDGNGNVVSMPGFSALTYDVSQRLASASPSSGGTEYYAYEPTNQRVWRKKPDGGEEVHFSTPEGERLGAYQVTLGYTGFTFYLRVSATNLYFGGKLIREASTAVVLDRLGSATKHPAWGTSRYFPYGEEYQTTAQDRTKFATYCRDASTALDYAQNRYYSSTQGRFLSPDPYMASSQSSNPQSWNRYAYVEDDPVNWYDPRGLEAESPPYNPYEGVLSLWLNWLLGNQGGSPPAPTVSLTAEMERESSVAETTAHGRSWATKAMQNLTENCSRTFNTVYEHPGNVASLTILYVMTNTISTIKFYDPYNGIQGGIRLSQATMTAFSPDLTLKEYLDKEVPDAVATVLPGGHIAYGSNWWFRQPGFSPSGENLRNVYSTFWHELLHIALSMDDREVAKYFDISYTVARGQSVGDAASIAITQWLRSDCGAKKQ